MEKRFKFTNERIKALPANPPDTKKGTDLEESDTEVIGLECKSGKNLATSDGYFVTVPILGAKFQ